MARWSHVGGARDAQTTVDEMDLHVEIVDPTRTYELRHAVLRPGRPFAETVDDDAFSAAVTFGLSEGADSRILSTATVYREEPPARCAPIVELAKTYRPWRLRAVATDASRRNEGLGRLVLGAITAYITADGPALLWCNARITAERFYAREGFVTEGPIFEVEHIGRHVVMYRAYPHSTPDTRTRPD